MTAYGDGMTVVEEKPQTGLGLDDIFQVTLWNDDVNDFLYVIDCLKKVFGHSEPIAERITMEAHLNGHAVAEVEDRTSAQRHAAQLGRMGLEATVESI